MRMCIITSDADLVCLDKKNLLSKIGFSPEVDVIDEIYIISCKWLKTGIAEQRFYPFLGDETFRLRICGRLLRIMNDSIWLPRLLSLLPLRLCKREIIEILLACDPDLVIIHDLGWRFQLQKLIHKRCPHLMCMTNPDGKPTVDLRWRKFDPAAKVSIVLPTYNGSKYIRMSLESCLKQTFANLEVIIVDDGSTENIARLVDCYGDRRLRFLRHQKNLGLAEALNTGFRNSTGDYLTWTSDDNYYMANAIEEMVRFLQTYPVIDFVYAEQYIINETNASTDGGLLGIRASVWLEVNNGIGACFLYKRKVYEAIGDYNPTLFLAEDYDYWVRISRQFRMQRLFKPLYYYRYHKESLTGRYARDEVQEKVKAAKLLNRRN